MNWIPITQGGYPPNGIYVAALRCVNHADIAWELITVKYDKGYLLAPWRDVDNDSVEDSGPPPTHWAFHPVLQGGPDYGSKANERGTCD